MASSRVERRADVLAEIGALLGSSLDSDRVLPRVVRLAVPILGDLCAIDVLHADGALHRVASAHVDVAKEALVFEIRTRYGFNSEAPHGPLAVVRARRPALVSRVTEADLRAVALNAEHLALFKQLAPKSWIIAPLVAYERALGTITLAITESSRRYEEVDLSFAMAVANQTAAAIEIWRLYREAQEARGAAEAANRAKDEFLSTLSHELRNPLNAVHGWATLIERGQLGEAQTRRAVQVIVRNVNAQIRLVDDLLDMSRVVSGGMRLVVQPVDLRELIEDSLEAVRHAADAKGIRIQRVLEAPEVLVSGDFGRLQQIVWNLLDNAVKFTPRDGRVQVHLQRVRSHAEIVISDTGQGIAPELLPYVFDRLRQGESGSTRSHGGLGIGLALVRHLAELHGGSVYAESAGEGKGATFVVKLPLMVAEMREQTIAAARERSSLESTALTGVHIVVVDDDPTALELIREVLAQAGAQVIECRSADEALRVIQQRSPDLIVSDIEMPGEDGHSLIRKVRALDPERGGKIPAIALTAFGRPEDRIRSLTAGFNIHVSKPVDPAELIAIAASMLGRAG